MNVVSNEPSTCPSFAELRAEARLTLAQLATAGGYKDATSIYAIERGTYPRLDRAVRIAEALGVTPEQLAASIARSAEQLADRTEPVVEEEAGGD